MAERARQQLMREVLMAGPDHSTGLLYFDIAMCYTMCLRKYLI